MSTKKSKRAREFKARLDKVGIVLYRPKLPENIGAVARVACNMGIPRVILVQPENLDWLRVRIMATQAAEHILQDMEVVTDLETALAPFSYVVGTTARQGGSRREVLTPREIAPQLVELSQHNDLALLFGPENWGLTNQELPLCQALVTIPTGNCASLNLSQAVLVLAYELFTTTVTKPRFAPRLANTQELESMYAILQDTLLKIDYISHQNPEYWMLNVRRFFSRHGLMARETQVIKGICRQIDWYVRRRRQGDKPED
jgi:tRNA/rRNA methyltransferase